MKNIILKVLKNVSDARQVNLESESARDMIASILEVELEKYVQQMIEDVVCSSSDHQRELGEDNEG